ncbi:8886_t:CDS:2 [Paraglomus brasilianum]|uniref:8886_t:CDS:1 n=1 Tax=Paraglomus brasilianum TaxID=144538 RepID=A0A9N9ANL3_9GLOM|nr:8886_t:CDS:2 [Paraglomus brasilianum]
MGVVLAIKEIKSKDWSAEEFWNIQIKDDHKTECNEFWQSVFKSLLQQRSISSDYGNENFVKKLFPDTEIPIVCSIDEAHELLTKAKGDETYFVQWRRQIRKISWVGFFNILLSTSGKIGKFLPPVTKDTISARSYDFIIFPAYLDVNTMDILASLAENVGLSRLYPMPNQILPAWV